FRLRRACVALFRIRFVGRRSRLRELAYVSGIIGTPTQAVEDELEHVVSALVRLGLLDMRQEADEQDDVAGVDVGPDGAIRLPGVEQHRDRVADRPEAVT